MKARNPSTGNLETVYVKALDSMPVGTEVDFDGQASDIPTGWEQVDNILWTNPNPTSDFASQNVTLNSDDYDMYEIIYKNYKTENYYMNTGTTPKGYGKLIMMIGGANGPYNYTRQVTFNSATSLTIGNCTVNYGTTTSQNNAQVIPVYIIGYKTGLFD